MKRKTFIVTTLSLIIFGVSSYAYPTPNTELKGSVSLDGSSTVFPISEAVAEEFGKAFPKIRVTVGLSGTGGGFKKFATGETDINDASREIQQSEIDVAKKNAVQYVALPVAYDGISVVVNPKNTWATMLTTQELKKIWMPGSTVQKWKDIRPEWPDRKIKLYGPGTDSGTFDYFTEAINGKSHVSRSDYTMSEDDNVLVKGVQGDLDALGYFGFAYYFENKGLLKVVPVKHGKDAAISPSFETINNGTYAPLSRKIYIYVNTNAAKKKPALQEFVRFYMKTAGSLVKSVGYVPLPETLYTTALNTFELAIK